MAAKLRVGIVHYLNSRPLAWGFRRGRYAERFAARYLSPARVADALAAGEIDVGLVPTIELQRIPGLRVVPGACVAASREVRSVLLIVKPGVDAPRRVSLDENSRTSAALVQILLAERYGLRPETVAARADLDAMLAESDAALLIGDPALAVDRTRYRVHDLAAEWRQWTGLPFVFAVWAVRAGVEAEELARPFRESLALAEAELEALIAEAADETGLPVASLHDYFTRCLHFHLGEAELAGIREFHRRAGKLGLIDRLQEVALWRE